MSPENLQEESQEPGPSALRAGQLAATREEAARKAGRSSKQRRFVVAFKFGGSSISGAERLLHAASLVREATQTASVAVVVSAMKGVTDALLSVANALAEGQFAQGRREAEVILRLHLDALHDLKLEAEDERRIGRELQLLGRDLLYEVPLHSRVTATPEVFDRLASFGERFSVRLFAAALRKLGVAAVPVTSSDFVLTCDTFRHAQPHLEKTKERGREVLRPLLEEGIVPVVTGFIGATPDGRITTLGRNSSDYSSAIVAHIVDADELVIWTDVDGIYTANPSESAEARLLHELSYDEARALAATGAKVLHAKVLPLAAEKEMVVWVRNTFNPEARGTRIGAPRDANGPVVSTSGESGGAV